MTKGRQLYFLVHRRTGYSKQLVVNLDLKMLSMGYFLFNPCFVTYTELPTLKELDKLFNTLQFLGYKPETEK